MNPREEEITARALLADQDLIDIYLHQRRWAELAALVRYVQRDVPAALATTDPALYRQLCEQITHFHLRGGACFSLPDLEARMNGEPSICAEQPRATEGNG
ncbi:MAG: hypothetical protein ABI680_20475 [Chthoniobacteraceae bacterium]